MAQATVQKTSFGYHLVGGNEATTVSTTPLQVLSFILIPEADDDFVTITDYAGNAVITFLGPNADEPTTVDWHGKRINGLISTLDDAASVLIVLVQ